ncbi:uncharacterized protein LOC132057867 [Lycium ferocissimum]|uniref:uncharacterized protein LOC132057867 n=1 Tax=Lycium ferocissimum TaxID=112874 RepID=UPI00281631A7|nr:uncharacterized protein LOC132057867 [Lycium ferocissimum]
MAISEPFINKNKIDGYKRFLRFHHSIANSSGQIWCFWNHVDHYEILENNDQQITIKLKDSPNDSGTYITAIYAKCLALERIELWDSITDVSSKLDGPWCMGGDFNVVMDTDEKSGGKPHRTYKSMDFITTMDSRGLVDVGYTGPKLTWCNNRRLTKRIWKRLDRVLVNDDWTQKFPNNLVKHLARTGSDHRPLLFKFNDDQ